METVTVAGAWVTNAAPPGLHSAFLILTRGGKVTPGRAA